MALRYAVGAYEAFRRPPWLIFGKDEFMPAPDFRCYLVERGDDKKISNRIASLPLSDLPVGDVLVRVAYSSLNFKDALAASGTPGVARSFPHIPGIDASGKVVESRDARFQPGDSVLVTGFELGAPAWGGFSEFIRVPANWLVPLPERLSLRESMIFGTAGFTAAIAIEILRRQNILPTSGEIIVTGATGGVGSLAVSMLARLGYSVVAVTGKPTAHEYLRKLGATTVIGRDEVDDTSGKPLLPARWAGAIDSVGGNTLATIVRSTHRAGCVTACGLVGGVELPLSVHPFILRGVCLAGVDSAEYPIERRASLWSHMAGAWRPADLEAIVAATVSLDELPSAIDRIRGGQMQGRALVQLGDE